MEYMVLDKVKTLKNSFFHPKSNTSKNLLYDHLPPISQILRVRRARHCILLEK